MNFKGPLLLMLSLSITCLDGAVYSMINTTNLVKCTFSSRHHNRILIEQGRVKKVVFPEGEIAIRIEEESGQIFVNTLTSHTHETTLSLVTDEGIVQDIELTFANIPSEVLVLQLEKEERTSPVFEMVNEQACASNLSSAYIVEEIISGKIPDGFVSYDAQNEEIKIKRCIKAVKTCKLVGPEEVIYIFEIHNKGFRTASLEECDFDFCNGLWVYLGSNSIAPHQKTFVIVSVRRT